MNKVEVPSVKKLLIVKWIMLAVLFLILMVCCSIEHNSRIYDSIKVVVSDTATIEYGNANYDLLKLIKEYEGDLVSIKKDVDTSVLGEQQLVLEVKKANMVKDIPIVVSVVDSAAPSIQIAKDRMTITSGEAFNLNDNVISIIDDIDGELELLKDDLSNGDSCYYFQYDDIESIGEHNITLIAVDSAGNVSSINFILEIVEPEPVVSVVYYNVAPNSAGNDIASIAYSLVGLPYVYGGTSPSGFDCSGFVQYVYSQVGIQISRSTNSQIYDGVPVSVNDMAVGDIILWGYGDGNVSHSSLYVGDGLMVHAANPNQGVIISNVNSWLNGSGSYIVSVRRI